MRYLAPLIMLALLVSFVRADDAKEVTFKGTLTCAKCDLKETAACQNVLKVKDGDKEVKYYLVDNKLSKDNHGKVCRAPMDGVSVTGTVEVKDGKNILTATKIEMPAADTK